MKRKFVSVILTAAVVAGTLSAATVVSADSGEGKVINIYSWNDEFRQRLEAVYPEVESTSKDGTVTTLKDGTEIHWVINPNQDGVYQQKLDEALMNQADAADDDKVDIFLSETDYVNKYKEASDKILKAKLAIDELREIQKRIKNLNIKFDKEQLKELEVYMDKLDYCVSYIKRL